MFNARFLCHYHQVSYYIKKLSSELLRAVLYSVSLSTLFLPITVAQAFASPIISEVYPAPYTGESEWVELFNPTDISINISGWKLYDQLKTPSLIYTLEPDTLLRAKSYLILSLSSNKLNNDSDGVVLYDDTGEVIDFMNYSETLQGKSWSRNEIGQQTFYLATPTPGGANEVPQNPQHTGNEEEDPPSPTPSGSPSPSPSSTTPSPQTPPTTPSPSPSPVLPHTPSPSPTPIASPPTNTSSQTQKLISIVAIYACPLENEPEWVEVKNNSTIDLNLAGWQVKDEQNNIRAFNNLENLSPPNTLAPTKTLRVTWNQAMLNNTGDSVYVLDNFGEVIASTTSPKCVKGEIYYPRESDVSTNEFSTDQGNTTSLGNNATDQSLSFIDQGKEISPSILGSSSTNNSYFRRLPTITTTTTTKNSAPEPQISGKAILVEKPPYEEQPYPFLSVILGGLATSLSGVVLFYEENINRLIYPVV